MNEYSYRIKNKIDRSYSKGGILPTWTTDPQFAKLWASKRAIKSHIAHCKRTIASRINSERYGCPPPTSHSLLENWQIEEIRLEVHNTFAIDKFV